MSACDDYQPFKYYVNGDVDYHDSHPGDPVKTMYGVDIGGVCVYPKANCSADTIGNECCDLKGERKHGYSIATNLYNYGGIVLAVVIGRILNALRSQWIAAQRDKAARVVQDKAKREAKREASGEHSESPTEEEADGEPGIAGPRYFAELTFREKAQMLFDAGGYLAYLVSGIIVSTKMTQEIAIELTSTQRVALQTGGTAFLVPFAILFSFLDDLVNIKVRFAIARMDFEEVNRRVRSGFVLGLLSGLAGAAIATLLTVNLGVFEDIVYPSGKSDEEEYPDCTALSSPKKVAKGFKTYFLLTVWQWPFNWALTSLNGFAKGSGQFWLLGWPAGIGNALTYSIWYAGLVNDFFEDKLLLLGVAYLAGSVFNSLVVIGAIVCNRPLRQKYGLRIPYLDATPPGLAETTWQQLLPDREFLVQSFYALIHRLVVVMSSTIGLYVAAFKGLTVAYKINTLTSILPQFSTAYATLWAFILQFAGSKYLAIGEWRGFRSLVLIIMFGSVLYIVLGLVTMLTWKRSIAEVLNQDACIYASEEACSDIYKQIFLSSSDSTVQVMQGPMSVAIVFELLVAMLLAALNVCQDYEYQAKWSAIAFVLAFVPAIIVASEAFEDSSSAIFIAMYFPHFLLLPMYAKRLSHNIDLMARGERGPWSREEKLEGDFAKALAARRTSIDAVGDTAATLNPIASPAAVELAATDTDDVTY